MAEVPDAIRFENVSVVRDGMPILQEVTATIPAQKITAVIGPNGAGKTTLLRAMLRLIPYDGKIYYGGRLSNSRRAMPPIGYVPQRLDFDRGMPITVLDFLAMATQVVPVWFGIKSRFQTRAMRSLERVQAAHLARQQLGKLSGGELQRVLLALALQAEPQILLLDEPVAGVDIAGEHLFCDLLDEVRQESKLTMVMVSHDLSVVSRHAEHVICLNRKLECTGPTPMVLNAANLQAIYGPHAGLYDHEGAGGHGHPHGHAHEHPHHHHHHHHHHHDHRPNDAGESSWSP